MAGTPFSALVATESWRAEAEGWARAALAEAGIAITGEFSQPRIRPWSTHLTVPTERGRFWLKACCPSMAFEPALQRAIATLLPGAAQEPMAIDAARGWMLTGDHGPTLGDRRTPTVQDWRSALAGAARAQRALAPHRDELLATGLPAAGPDEVVGRFDRILDLQEPDLARRLRARRPELVDACAVLAGSRLPATWQHGDLHPQNLFGDADSVAFFDLGDGSWAHAVEILSVPYGIVSQDGELDWQAIVGAWTDVWELEPAEFADLWHASGLTHAVNRAITWHGALATATSTEIEDWGDAVTHHLTRMLDT